MWAALFDSSGRSGSSDHKTKQHNRKITPTAVHASTPTDSSNGHVQRSSSVSSGPVIVGQKRGRGPGVTHSSLVGNGRSKRPARANKNARGNPQPQNATKRKGPKYDREVRSLVASLQSRLGSADTPEAIEAWVALRRKRFPRMDNSHERPPENTGASKRADVSSGTAASARKPPGTARKDKRRDQSNRKKSDSKPADKSRGLVLPLPSSVRLPPHVSPHSHIRAGLFDPKNDGRHGQVAVCQNYIQGKCRHGDRCWRSHDHDQLIRQWMRRKVRVPPPKLSLFDQVFTQEARKADTELMLDTLAWVARERKYSLASSHTTPSDDKSDNQDSTDSK